MQTAATREDYVKQTKTKYEKILLARAGVISVGISMTERGLGLIVSVESEKVLVPFSLEGFPVTREVIGQAKARIESVGINSTGVWMLGDRTLEEAKKHVLSNPNFADVTFRGDNVLRDDNIIGYLRHDGGVYYFNPVGGDLPYLGETLSPQRNRDIRITADDTTLRYRDTAMLGETVVHDHITKSNSYYTADFEWLLQEKLKAPFDLFVFTEYPTKLVYSGELRGVPITITLDFPAVIGHCHYHVFWSV